MKTTLTAAGAAIMALLSMLALAPSELGDVSTLIAPEWKARIFLASAIAAFVLRVINGHFQQDKTEPPQSK